MYKNVTVVFTFQTEGRYNMTHNSPKGERLFLPFKQKADTTLVDYANTHDMLFLPFKQKADTTRGRNTKRKGKLFLPFKQKADTTLYHNYKTLN